MAHEVYDVIKPANGQTFPVVEANDIKGGVHYVEKYNDLETLKSENKKLLIGMLCYVKETNKTYILEPNIVSTYDPVYSTDFNNLIWREFTNNKCLIVTGSLYGLEVPADVNTIIIGSDLKYDINTNYAIARIYHRSSLNPTVRIINQYKEPITVLNNVDAVTYTAGIPDPDKTANIDYSDIKDVFSIGDGTGRFVKTDSKTIYQFGDNIGTVLKTYKNSDSYVYKYDFSGPTPIKTLVGTIPYNGRYNYVCQSPINPSEFYLVGKYEKDNTYKDYVCYKATINNDNTMTFQGLSTAIPALINPNPIPIGNYLYSINIQINNPVTVYKYDPENEVNTIMKIANAPNDFDGIDLTDTNNTLVPYRYLQLDNNNIVIIGKRKHNNNYYTKLLKVTIKDDTVTFKYIGEKDSNGVGVLPFKIYNLTQSMIENVNNMFYLPGTEDDKIYNIYRLIIDQDNNYFECLKMTQFPDYLNYCITLLYNNDKTMSILGIPNGNNYLDTERYLTATSNFGVKDTYQFVPSYDFKDPNIIDKSQSTDSKLVYHGYAGIGRNRPSNIQLRGCEPKCVLSTGDSIELVKGEDSWVEVDRNVTDKNNQSNLYNLSKITSDKILSRRKITKLDLNSSSGTISMVGMPTDIDYNGVKVPSNPYVTDDILTIISKSGNVKILLTKLEDVSCDYCFIGDTDSNKIENYIYMRKNSRIRFICTYTGKYFVWSKLDEIDQEQKILYADINTATSSNKYTITPYKNCQKIIINSLTSDKTSTVRNIFTINPNYITQDKINPEILLCNELKKNTGKTKIYQYNQIYGNGNIDLSSLNASLNYTYVSGADEKAYWTIPNHFFIRLRYDDETSKWIPLEARYSNHQEFNDQRDITINVAEVMTDTTIYAGTTDTKLANNDNIRFWRGYDAKGTIENGTLLSIKYGGGTKVYKNDKNPKYGRTYFNWYKNILVDGRTKTVTFDLTEFYGLRWNSRTNESIRNQNSGWQLPTILEIYNISKDPNSEYELIDGQEITFSIKESNIPVFFSVHFVHANTQFKRYSPSTNYTKLFKQDRNKTEIPAVAKSNIILKSLGTSAENSTLYPSDKYVAAGYYAGPVQGNRKDLPLEVPDLILKTSPDYNNSDYFNDEEKSLFNINSNSKLSTVTFKYDKTRNLWFEYKRDIGTCDARKVVSLVVQDNKGSADYLKKSILIDPETDSIITNTNYSTFPPLTGTKADPVEAAKRYICLTNISLGNFDYLQYNFLTSKNDSCRFKKYDKYYKGLSENEIIMEYIKNIFYDGDHASSVTDNQQDAVEKMMMRMQIGCFGKRLSIFSMGPTRLLSTQAHGDVKQLPDPFRLKTSSIENVKLLSSISVIPNSSCYYNDGTLHDPTHSLIYLENKSGDCDGYTIKNNPSNYGYYNSTAMQDWIYETSNCIYDLYMGNAMDLMLYDIWYPINGEKFAIYTNTDIEKKVHPNNSSYIPQADK